MKLAFVSDVIFPYNKSGRSRRLYELANRLSKKHEVHIYTMKWWEGANHRIENNIHLHAVCKNKPLWIGNKRSIWQAVYFSCRLFFPLLFSKAEIIDCDQYPHFPCYTAKLVSVIRRKPLIITWHEIWGKYWNEYMGIFGYAGRALEWLTGRLTKFNVVNSESTKARLELISNQPARLILPGTKIQQGAAKRKGILYVGRISREKNLDTFLKVARILANETFTVIGSGPDEPQIKGLAESYGLDIRFLGDVTDNVLFSQLRSHKFFVSASTREGFSIAVLEAMGSGTPPIVVSHPDNAAVNFVPGELVASLDENSIAGKILGCDSKRYSRISAKVRGIAENFSWEKAARNYEAFICNTMFSK
jgi:glycosyltransferase involved in cell wall biosynthesis